MNRQRIYFGSDELWPMSEALNPRGLGFQDIRTLNPKPGTFKDPISQAAPPLLRPEPLNDTAIPEPSKPKAIPLNLQNPETNPSHLKPRHVVHAGFPDFKIAVDGAEI